MDFMTTPLELLEFIESVCKRPSMYTPNGTFYECACYLEGFAIDRVSPSFRKTGGHNPFLGFIKWALTKWQVDYSHCFVGWKLYREFYNSDQEAFENFPKLFREFLETLE